MSGPAWIVMPEPQSYKEWLCARLSHPMKAGQNSGGCMCGDAYYRIDGTYWVR